MPVYVQALLEQTAENMENLQRILARGEDGRLQSNQAMLALAERIGTLSDTMRASQQLMLRIAEGQQALGPALQRLGDAARRRTTTSPAPICATSSCSAAAAGEIEQGRSQSTGELRNEIRVLTRTIAALAERSSPP